MKAKGVLKLLNISRTTLYNCVKSGKLPIKKLHNGYYDHDDTTVDFFSKQQKNDLNTQLKKLLKTQNYVNW